MAKMSQIRKREKAEEKKLAAAWFARVAELGCLICGKSPQIHHKTGAGMGKKAPYKQTMPLCIDHHTAGAFGECVHNGTKSFEAKYGTQDEMIAKTHELLGEYDDDQS